jgi:[acyl-carrier-protein] S-malonyltransferase
VKRGLLFPGQGSQVVGMGAALYAAHPAARAVFDSADQTLGFALTTLCFEGPAGALTATEIAQPALLTHAIAVLAAIKASEPECSFDAVAGHSLGEWTALVAADALRFEDAVMLVHQRGRWMQEAVPVGIGAMAAVLGFDEATVRVHCADASDDAHLVVPATFNGAGNTVVSGHAVAVDRLTARITAEGKARVLPVKVSAPFHSPLMTPVEAPLRAALDAIPIQAPRVPVRSTARDGWLETAEDVRAALIEQLTAPVLWEHCMAALVAADHTEARVVGAGRSLARMVQRLRHPWSVKTLSGPTVPPSPVQWRGSV